MRPRRRATSTWPSTPSRRSIDPLGNYFNYHSSQFEPDGANDAQVNDAGIDAALDTVKNSVDFKVIKDAMAEFQKVYVEKTVEIPLYYRKNVDLVSAEGRQLLRQPDPGRPDVERGRLVRQGVRLR